MKYPLNKLLSAAILVFFAGGGTILAFSSVSVLEIISHYLLRRPGGYIHRQITEKAFEGLGVKKQTVDQISYWVWRVDWDEAKKTPSAPPNECYRGAHHFDRNKPEEKDKPNVHAEAFMRGVNFVAGQRKLVIAGLNGGQNVSPDDTIEALGRALHALEDIFSHSNYVDLPAAEQEQVKDALNSASAPPASLKLTGYNKQNGDDLEENEGTQCSPAHDYGHRLCSKDDLTGKFREAKKPSGNGKTKFEAARDAAIAFVNAWLTDLKKEAGSGWNKLNTEATTKVGKIPMKPCSSPIESAAIQIPGGEPYPAFLSGVRESVLREGIIDEAAE